VIAHQFDVWCVPPVVEGVQNQRQKQYNPNNQTLSTRVQTNSGNIQYMQDHIKKIDPLEKHVADIQTNVDKLNSQMASIKSSQKDRANKSQKATSKPVTGLH